ncbi:MAG: DUF4430 domain-containing protein, partial [Gaiellaceae bacterium]
VRREGAGRVIRAAVIALAVGVGLGGCGFGEGDEQDGGASLRVTQDFGREELAADEVEAVREDQTVLRLLQSHHDVETRFGGKFVEAIDGVEGSGGGGTRDWFFFVNGVLADEGAGDWEVEVGDVIQWDNRDWSATQRIPAIVGAYPEPFRSGTEGERLPVRLECADSDDEACGDVKDSLTEAGARVSSSQLAASGGQELIRVLVGTWDELRDVRTPATLEEGPEASGVFARFADEGERLELLDEDGDVVRTADAGTGLVAATALEQQAVVWLVTGLEDVGVQAAAAILDARSLRNAFAVAATPDGPVKLPLSEEDGE